jgi:hypothetical protein
MMFALTGYLDESGTHDGEAVIVMGGFLGRADQWKNFQVAFNKVKQRHGFQIFHTVKFKNKKGDFKGWSDNQIEALYWDLRPLVSFGLTDSVAISLDKETFNQHYKADGTPTKGRLDSAYGLCFRMCLYYFLLQAMKRKRKGKFPDLHIVLEAGHRNSGDAERIFLEVKKEFAALGLLRTLRLAEKDECDPLMIADFAAHSTLLLNRRARAEDRPLPSSDEVPRGFVGISHFLSTPEGLANIREHALKMAAVHRRVRREATAEN